MPGALGSRSNSLLRRKLHTLRGVLDGSRAKRVELLRNAAGLPLPVYLSADGTPSAQPTQGTVPHRVMVCSIPKAGTYFIGELLRRLDVVPTGLHLAAQALTDYRFATREEARNEFTRFWYPVPLERAVKLVLPGQFAVGHLEHSPFVREQLAGFKVVFAYRELRDAFVSWLRFHHDTAREEKWRWIWTRHREPRERLVVFLREAGDFFFTTCRMLQPWLTDGSAFPVRFETLIGDDGPEAQMRLCRELAEFLDHPNAASAPATVLPGLTTTTTLTSSGSRTKHAEYWSDEAEELFMNFGGAELNAALGYNR